MDNNIVWTLLIVVLWPSSMTKNILKMLRSESLTTSYAETIVLIPFKDDERYLIILRLNEIFEL